LDEFLAEFPELPPPVDQAELDGEPVHAAKLDKHEGVVDWSRPARQVIDHIRGMDPWPAAVTRRGDLTLKLFAAGRSEHARPSDAEPGTVIAVDELGLHVCTGDAVVRVGEVQAPGKRRMSARDHAAGQPFADGERLGAGGPCARWWWARWRSRASARPSRRRRSMRASSSTSAPCGPARSRGWRRPPRIR